MNAEVTRYLNIVDAMRAARRDGRYRDAIAIARRGWPLIEPFLKSLPPGGLGGVRIRLIDDVLDLMVADVDIAGLGELSTLVTTSPVLRMIRQKRVDRALGDLQLAQRLRACVAEHPGVIQAKLPGLLGLPRDRLSMRRVVELGVWMERMGTLERVKFGPSFRLSIPGQDGGSEMAPEKACKPGPVPPEGRRSFL